MVVRGASWWTLVMIRVHKKLSGSHLQVMVSSSEPEKTEIPRERRPRPAILSLRSIVAIFSRRIQQHQYCIRRTNRRWANRQGCAALRYGTIRTLNCCSFTVQQHDVPNGTRTLPTTGSTLTAVCLCTPYPPQTTHATQHHHKRMEVALTFIRNPLYY